MTDTDIIKALECCSSPQVNACDDCPFHERCYNNDEFIEKEAIDLINRQNAEIERLTTIVDDGAEVCHNCHSKYAEKIKQEKAEAVKEFAERFKKIAIKDKSPIFRIPYYQMSVETFDNLVKEMVGETNEQK